MSSAAALFAQFATTATNEPQCRWSSFAIPYAEAAEPPGDSMRSAIGLPEGSAPRALKNRFSMHGPRSCSRSLPSWIKNQSGEAERLLQPHQALLRRRAQGPSGESREVRDWRRGTFFGAGFAQAPTVRLGSCAPSGLLGSTWGSEPFCSTAPSAMPDYGVEYRRAVNRVIAPGGRFDPGSRSWSALPSSRAESVTPFSDPSTARGGPRKKRSFNDLCKGLKFTGICQSLRSVDTSWTRTTRTRRPQPSPACSILRRPIP